MHWNIKTYMFAGVCAVLVLVFVAKMYTSRDFPTIAIDYSGPVSGHETDAIRLVVNLIQQRNNVSRQLNSKQQLVGQMQCEKQESAKVARSETGGWCKQSSKENSGHHMTDMKIIAPLAELFTGKHVASFGDGPGRYKQLLSDTGKLQGYDAYDGAPFGETTSEGRVKYLDLTLPQYGLPMYDWVISLEVAEHIPAQFEAVYMDNIARHAREGVVLSWARPGQGGYSHVNNRPFEYVVKLFDDLGFSHDQEASQKLKDSATLDWLKWNTNVYRRRDTSHIDSHKVLYA